MMNFKRKAIITALLASVALVMALAGCQNAPASQVNTPIINSNANTLANSPATLATGEQNPASTGITVTGQGKSTMKPDVAFITLGVETQNIDVAKARAANNIAMAKVKNAVKGFGVADEDITTTNYNIYPYYDEKGSVVQGYRVENTINVRVKDLTKLGDLLTAASTAGANTAYGISFDVQDHTSAYNEALGFAMDDAARRAKTMADALGVKLGKAIVITESSSSPGPVKPGMSEGLAGAKDAAVPTSSGTVDITASVSVVYEILK